MALGFAVWRLSPDAFWRLTPREIAAASHGLSSRRREMPPTRRAFDELLKRFPDKP